MRKITFLFIAVLAILTSCIDEWDKALDKDVLKNSWVFDKAWLHKENCKIEPAVYQSSLDFSMEIKGVGSLWRDSIMNDTITDFKLYARFYDDKGKIIFLPKELQTISSLKKYSGEGNFIRILIEGSIKNHIKQRTFSIPLILFKDLKVGEKAIVIELYGMKCYKKDSHMVEIPEPRFKARWKVIFKMPEIYETVVYCGGVYLENDDKFSPVGMDFGFRQGLPDIYWTIFIPAKNKSDYSNFYWRSNEATYAYNYTDSDTVLVYTTKPDEKMIIGVYDRDDFSRDDFIGDVFCRLNDCFADTFKHIHFDHITDFRIRADFKGCVNIDKNIETKK